MASKKSTKKALLTSVLSLLLCCSMLIGTTFAWFTDEVHSGINQIVAGKLDVEVYHGDPADKNSIEGTTELFNDVTLWEPGAVAYEVLTVLNLGNLALKYQMAVNFSNENTVNGYGLSQVLKVAVVDASALTDRDAALAAAKAAPSAGTLYNFTLTGKLDAKDHTNDTYGIVIWWEPSDLDNNWNVNNGKTTSDGQPLHIDLGIKLVATQLTHEYDAFGNDYDAMSGGYYHVEYGFSNPADLLAFAPVAGDAASSGLSINADGEAQINKSGAWYTVNVDLSAHEYIVEYDIDITDLAIGENVTVDTGETAGWGSTPIMLERGSTKVYYGTWKNEHIGDLQGTVVHVTHVYKYNSDNKLEITTTVSDGIASVTYSKAVASAAKNELYWDIYTVSEAEKATMDNFSVKAADAVVDSDAELATALAEGGNIVLTDDISSGNGFEVLGDTVLDLNGHTLTATGTRAYLFTVEGDVDLTLVNGELVAESTNGQVDGTGESTGASSSVYFASTGTLTMTDVKVQGSVRGGHRAIEVYGGTAVLTNVDITTSYGSGVNSGSGANVTLNDCDITVNGMYSAPYNSVAFSVMGGASMTINSGSYTMINDNTYATGDTHGGWVGIVMNSGGTLTINGGVYTNVPTTGFMPQHERAIIEAENLDPATATVNLYGGTFIPQHDNIVSGYGDVNYPVVNAYLIDNGDGTWTAVPKIEGVDLSAVPGYSHLYTDGTNYYVYDAEGLISMNQFWIANWCGNNMWGRSYNVMADIDATGYTWNEAYVVVGSNDNNGFVFDGHGHTVTGLTINGGLFSGTPNGSAKPNNPGYVKNITFDGVTVVGDHWAGVLWSNVHNELVVENVSVINSTITGKCNVAALVGGTVIDGAPDASVKFIDCVVKNNVITAEGKNGQDPNGANVYVSRVYGNSAVTFENCVSEGNTVTNNNGLVGGGIYGYTIWANGGFTGTGTCDSFTNWDGVTVVTENTNEALADAISGGASEVVLPDGNYTLPSSSIESGSKITIAGNGENTVFDFTKVNGANNASITFENVHFQGINANTMNGFGIQNTTGHIVFKNCTFDGAVTNEYYGSVEYIDCTFTGTGYITTYAVKSAVFTNCVFDKADSRALLVYSHGDNPVKVTVTDCEFKAAAQATTWAGDWTSAIEIDTTNIPTLGTSVTIEDCTYDANYSGLYRDKSAAGKANAVITVK